MDKRLFEDYVPRFTEEELDRLYAFYDTEQLYKRGVMFIAFLYVYEKGALLL